ncbi:MAG TPA: response regulator transcription factor [Patescibacteria group bacterium]|nr:response regulator transcription factor [Patescibacteria group bacterium]
MRQKTILIADDDPQIRELLNLYFSKEDFAVIEAADGKEALEKAGQAQLVILDIMMPVMDGLEVCRELRRTSQVPVIMLTARMEDEDRILGLELGADDYMGKPFNPRELVARVKAVLRRTTEGAPAGGEVLRLPELVIDMAGYTVTAFGQEVLLTSREIELFYHLASHPGRVYTREQLLESVWGYDYCGDTGTVDTHIKRLRQKISAGGDGAWSIKTVWGVGYKFELKKP